MKIQELTVRPSLHKPLQFFHTVRYLKPIQIYGRIWFQAYHPKPVKAPAPMPARPKGKWVQPPLRPQTLTGPMTFCHLNEPRALSPGGPWCEPEASHLWNYHLHYFDDLVAEGAKARRHWHKSLISRWIRDNPPGISPGWDPYPTSRRIINWIKADLDGQILGQAALDSLAMQVRYLVRKPEYHLQGNHLWVNAKAMIFAGLFFGGQHGRGEAGKWLATGWELAARQFSEQIRPDGSHFEQSPMYHALMLEDVLDLINLGRAYEWGRPEAWCGTAGKMFGYINAACHPDGQLALFNDCALNVAPTPWSLRAYGQRMGIEPAEILSGASRCQHFPDSGLIRAKGGAWTLLFDTGPIGPDYIPGHAHADSLTFELSLFGSRIVVDTGTGIYGTGEHRRYQRSTEAHNTVRVDGVDSSEVWSGFRVAQRARPVSRPEIRVDEGRIMCRAGHDGYTRLPGKVIHARQITIEADAIEIKDILTGHHRHQVEVFLHFHPDFLLECAAGGWAVIERASAATRARVTLAGVDRCWKEKYQYSPEFGIFLQGERLVGWKHTRLPYTIHALISRH